MYKPQSNQTLNTLRKGYPNICNYCGEPGCYDICSESYQAEYGTFNTHKHIKS